MSKVNSEVDVVKMNRQPLHERFILKYLPYYDKLREEVTEHIVKIKSGLASSLLLRECRPGLQFWISQIESMINVYGYCFTKEDHIMFVKIIYELLASPDIDYPTAEYLCTALVALLKKWYYISPKDLQLNWKVLFALYERVIALDLDDEFQEVVPKGLPVVLTNAVKLSSMYFSKEATQEILNRLRPSIGFLTGQIKLNIFITLCNFLPAANVERECGYELWFDELMYLWQNMPNSGMWEYYFVELLQRLAKNNVGCTDWNPHMNFIFNKILRQFRLSVKDTRDSSNFNLGGTVKSYDLKIMGSLVCYMATPKNDVLKYLDRLFKAVQSYCHPSNSGKWQNAIFSFIEALCLNICERLNRERCPRKGWLPTIPDDCQLDDQYVSKLVSSILPCVQAGMFGKGSSAIVASCFHYLSRMDPAAVVPIVLDSCESSLLSITEPHRMQQSLASMIAVGLPLLRLARHDANGLRLIPFLKSLQSTIDVFDFSKISTILETLSYFFQLLPLVDNCDTPLFVDNLNDIEKELCAGTALFEDIVDGFVDWLLYALTSYGNNVSNGNSNASDDCPEANVYKEAVSAVGRFLLANSSDMVVKNAMENILRFAEENEFESGMAMVYIAELCCYACEANFDYCFKRIWNLYFGRLKSMITEETKNEEEVHFLIINNIMALDQFLRFQGKSIVEFVDDMLELFDLLLPLQAPTAVNCYSVIVETVLMQLTEVKLDDAERNKEALNQSVDRFIAIRNWGEQFDSKNFQMTWKFPGQAEVDAVSRIFEKILYPQLRLLEQPEKLTKNQIVKCLNLTRHCISGASVVLPFMDGKLIDVTSSKVPRDVIANHSVYDCYPTLDCDGKNIRNMVKDTVNNLLDYMLANREHETAVLEEICWIYQDLLMSRGCSMENCSVLEEELTNLHKKMSDEVKGRNGMTKILFAFKVKLFHQKRLVCDCEMVHNESHTEVFSKLFKLLTSPYNEIREYARGVFNNCFETFPFSSKFVFDMLLDTIAKYNSDSNDIASRARFKGAMRMLHDCNEIIRFYDSIWQATYKLWMSLARCPFPREPLEIAMFMKMGKQIQSCFQVYSIKFTVRILPLSLIQVVKMGHLLCENFHMPSYITEADIEEAVVQERQRNENNEQTYKQLICELVDIVEEQKLPWSQECIVLKFLILQLHKEVAYPYRAVQLFFKQLRSDHIQIRRMAIKFFSRYLVLQKPKVRKVPLKIPNESPLYADQVKWPHRWGIRADNAFCIYDRNKLPKTAQEWNEATFAEKLHCGFYCWSRECTADAPLSAQPSVDRPLCEMNDSEVGLYTAFTDAEFVEKFSMSLTLDSKDIKPVDMCNCKFFRGLFFTFGESILTTLKPILEKLVESERPEKQRLAAEISSGLLYGMRLWPYEMQQRCLEWFSPMLEGIFDSFAPETMNNWLISISEGFVFYTVEQMSWFVEIVVRVIKRAIGTASQRSNYLYVLGLLLFTRNWQMMNVWNELLPVVESKMADPSPSVQEAYGRMLRMMFHSDSANITNEMNEEIVIPSADLFVGRCLASMENLILETEMSAPDELAEENLPEAELERREKRSESIWKLQTLLNFAFPLGSYVENMPVRKCVLKLLPLLCYFENESSGVDLKELCQMKLKFCLSRIMMTENEAACFLEQCEIVTKRKWWKARISMLHVLQFCAFSNLFSFNTDTNRDRLVEIIFSLLRDDQLEVRKAASNSLSSLLHCSFIQPTGELTSAEAEVRHAGILGLSAIVSSQPYAVPNYLPDILMRLCRYVNDSAHIVRTSVKETLSEFKRTHVDSWREHQLQFTDEQLSVLTGLFLSPNGLAFAHQIFLHFGIDSACGGDYVAFEKSCRICLCVLKQSDICPVFFMDGKIDEVRYKRRTTILRQQSRMNLARQMSEQPSSKLLLPPLACDLLHRILTEHNITVYYCAGEADAFIAAYANHHNYPVLSSDSDFFIFPLRAGYIPLPSVEWESCNGVLKCSLYQFAHCEAHFPNLKPEVMPLFAVLSGNDFVRGDLFRSFYNQISKPVVMNGKEVCKTRQHRNMNGLLNWLRGKSFAQAVEGVLGYVKKSSVRSLRQIILSGAKFYQNTRLMGNCEDPTRLTRRQLKNLPDWLVELYCAGQMPCPIVIAIRCNQTLILPTFVEDFTKPTIYDSSTRLREALYGIILKDTGKLQVKEYVRLDQAFRFRVISVSSEWCSLSDIGNMTSSELRAQFLRIVDCDEAEIINLSENLQLYFLSLRYWSLSAAEFARKNILIAFIAVAYCLFSVSATGQGLPKPFRLLNAIPVLDTRMKSKLYLQITHSVNIWQASLTAMTWLNYVLREPFKWPKISTLFSGRMLINLACELSRDVKPMNLLEKKYFASAANSFASFLEFCKPFQNIIDQAPLSATAKPRKRRRPKQKSSTKSAEKSPGQTGQSTSSEWADVDEENRFSKLLNNNLKIS
ncbi:Proteasome activator complex subunit 4 [Trichinella sp. T8]|nr:Proteasome activator complex subunit 4 [Trichinella sp. T8]